MVGWSVVEDMMPVGVVSGWVDEVAAAPSFFSTAGSVFLLNHILDHLIRVRGSGCFVSPASRASQQLGDECVQENQTNNRVKFAQKKPQWT